MTERRPRKFNPHRRPVSPSLRRFIDALVVRLLEKANRLRAIKRADRETFAASVEAILCDLVACSLSWDAGLIVCLSHAKLYGSETRQFYSDLERSVQFARVLKLAHEAGLLELNTTLPWVPQPGRTLEASTIAPSPELLQLVSQAGWSFADDLERVSHLACERLVLKSAKDPETAYWDDAKAISYPETSLTEQLRREIEEIAANLNELSIEMLPSADSSYQADVADRHVRRIFLLGRTEFDRGGRIAGGFWSNMPASERDRLRINGEPVAVLDFGQLNISLCYALKGAAMPDGDAYAITGAPKEIPRKHWKTFSSALLFVGGPKQRYPRGLNKALMGGLSVAEATRLLREAHKPIAACFESEVGYELQYHESTMLVEILKRCPYALPLHDAVEVPLSKLADAQAVMGSVFEAYTGKLGRSVSAKITATACGSSVVSDPIGDSVRGSRGHKTPTATHDFP